jgi:hypothetical protein
MRNSKDSSAFLGTSLQARSKSPLAKKGVKGLRTHLTKEKATKQKNPVSSDTISRSLSSESTSSLESINLNEANRNQNEIKPLNGKKNDETLVSKKNSESLAHDTNTNQY